jgi:hypothetical protein
MPTEQVQAPKPLIVTRVESPIFTFDPIADLLGARTVGEVFKVALEETVRPLYVKKGDASITDPL